MKLNSRRLLTSLLILISTISHAQKASLFVINEESFEIPGNWKFIGHIEESGQFHLTNKKEKLNLMISVRKSEYFEFYQENLSEKELLDKFYKWEYDYWSSPNARKTEVSETKRNEEKNYIIWKINIKNMPENDNNDKISYLLYTVKNNKLISLNLSNNRGRKNQLTEIESIEHLEKIHLK